MLQLIGQNRLDFKLVRLFKMKKFLIFIFFFLNFNSAYSEIKIAYIDINYILTNSIVGKSISEHISAIEKSKKKEFDLMEKNLSKKDKDIVAKKNIIEENELQMQINLLKEEINNYQKEKKLFIKDINEKKLKYTKVVLNSLNGIISEFVEKNSILIVFPKKDIVVAKKSLDITGSIIKILNDKLTKIDF